MKNLIGKITAELIDRELSVTDDLVTRINDTIKPPEPVTAEAVHIRAMHIVSDRITAAGGCFPADEHDSLARLLIDSPVLIGHRKDSLPIARNFQAKKVIRDGANWIKVYFYWLKDSRHGEDLRKNIDSGIYKEGSISFIFGFPECSICGQDIRTCGHHPFEKYKIGDNEEKVAHFNYRRIERVLETSLVYRGAVSDTTITGELFAPAQPSEENHTRCAAEPAVLKAEFHRRIIAMLRAVRAARPEQNNQDRPEPLPGDPADLSADDLVRLHRRAIRQFQRRFPASFTCPGDTVIRHRLGDWPDYKI